MKLRATKIKEINNILNVLSQKSKLTYYLELAINKNECDSILKKHDKLIEETNLCHVRKNENNEPIKYIGKDGKIQYDENNEPIKYIDGSSINNGEVLMFYIENFSQYMLDMEKLNQMEYDVNFIEIPYKEAEKSSREGIVETYIFQALLGTIINPNK